MVRKVGTEAGRNPRRGAGMKPLAIELFCGTFGWSAGWLEMGGRSVGFDLEHLPHHGKVPKGADLVIQDVMTLHGTQFRDADILLASPPCPEFSYMAMPWSRAKQIAAALRETVPFPDGYTGSRNVTELTALFDACFRIQREACEAAGRYIPMVVENVKGTQPWVGRAKANFGSFYLWGDVAMVGKRVVCGGQFGNYTQPKRNISKVPGLANGTFPGGGLAQGAINNGMKSNPDGTAHPQGSWFAVADSRNLGAARKIEGFNFYEHEKTGNPGRSFQSAAVDGTKGFTTGLGMGHDWRQDPSARFNSKSSARKAASAQIAKIPLALSQYVARCYYPRIEATA